ncbi:MAG: TIM barrel protein [Planctomycetaceae bacterium]|nr:TIM barrel protein [Planctomycetaceae bacterium]
MKRREFLQRSALAGAALGLGTMTARSAFAAADDAGAEQMRFGLVTYQWGRDWDLPTLLSNCERTGALGVELRTTHAHGVEPSLSDAQRLEVKQRFADSPVVNVGIGSNERYDNPDPAVVKAAIDATKAFIVLSHDIGTTGVKVKPDRFHENVPHEQTIEQIGRSLNELGKFADGYGQQVRLEVHGECRHLPTIKSILDVADHPSVAICWNSNPADLEGSGLEANFRLVRERFGNTLHVRELDDKQYPFARLIELLAETRYTGWVLMEASSEPSDRVAALQQQRELFDSLLAKALSK